MNSLVTFRSEGSALTLALFLLSPGIVMLCHCSSTMTKDHFLMILYMEVNGLCVPMCIKTLIYSFIPDDHEGSIVDFGIVRRDDICGCMLSQSKGFSTTAFSTKAYVQI